MNDLQAMSKKLKHIANLIDDLFIEKKKENQATARKITKRRKPFNQKMERHMTVKARKAISKRMKAYWRKRKAA